MSNTIVPLKNGPLKLDSTEQLIHVDNQPIESKPVASLCRCGLSKNKPFCDGAHRNAGFSDTRDIEQEVIQHYPGRQVTINFNRSICSGAARCVNTLPSVFSSESSEDWISPDDDSLENIRAAVERCPSGALSLHDVKEVIGTEATKSPRIDVVQHGPYNVQNIELVERPTASHANVLRYALCRCGLSKNKPYCDYSHAEKGWRDDS